MLEKLQIPKQANRSCKVASVAQTLDESDSKIFLAAVNNPDWAIKTLARELQKFGVEISDSPLSNHRKKSCACTKL